MNTKNFNKVIKNISTSINNRLDDTEKWISNVKDRVVDIIQGVQ